jgi:hypothetical protein
MAQQPREIKSMEEANTAIGRDQDLLDRTPSDASDGEPLSGC